MNVLIIGFDHSLFFDDVAQDTKKRHIEYAAELNRRIPNSKVFMTVYSPRDANLEATQLSENLKAYPTNSLARVTFFKDAFLIGKKLCSNHTIDLITAQSPFDDGLVGYLLKRGFGCKLLLQLHGSSLDNPNWYRANLLLNRFKRIFGKNLFRRADGIRVVSHFAKEWLQRELLIPEDRVFLCPVSISLPKMSDNLNKSKDSDTKEILFVGRLAPEKDLPTLLKAFKIVSKQFSKVHLTIVGDGDERTELEKRVKDMDLAERVKFEGSVAYEDLPPYYSSAEFVVLPSLHESYGRTIIEAFSFARPVIATDTEGAMASIEDGETGFIVPKTSPKAIAKKMLYLLKHPDMCKRMGIKAQNHVQESYDPKRLRQKLIEIWIKVTHMESKKV